MLGAFFSGVNSCFISTTWLPLASVLKYATFQVFQSIIGLSASSLYSITLPSVVCSGDPFQST